MNCNFDRPSRIVLYCGVRDYLLCNYYALNVEHLFRQKEPRMDYPQGFVHGAAIAG